MRAIAIPLSLATLFCATPLLAQQQMPNGQMPMQGMPMENMPGMKGTMQPGEAEGVGIVKAIDPQQGTITLQHQAIESIHWPAMTMTFKVAKPDILKGVKVGERVHFGLHPNGANSKVTWIKPAGA